MSDLPAALQPGDRIPMSWEEYEALGEFRTGFATRTQPGRATATSNGLRQALRTAEQAERLSI